MDCRTLEFDSRGIPIERLLLPLFTNSLEIDVDVSSELSSAILEHMIETPGILRITYAWESQLNVGHTKITWPRKPKSL